MAKLVRRHTSNVEIVGSTPTGSIFYFIINLLQMITYVYLFKIAFEIFSYFYIFHLIYNSKLESNYFDYSQREIAFKKYHDCLTAK